MENSDPLPPPDGFVGQPEPSFRRTRRTTAEATEKLPPHSESNEQGVLGCMLLAPKEAVPEAIRLLGESDQVFYDVRHQCIYAHMVGMFGAGKEIDIITLAHRLGDFELLEEAGGLPYLSELPDKVPSAANLPSYAEVVREKHMLRRAIKACSEAIQQAYEPPQDRTIDSLLDEMERNVLDVRKNGAAKESKGMLDLVKENMFAIEDYHQGKGALTGLSTGFTGFDALTRGLQRGEMNIIAGRPSVGKSAIAMNIVDHVAVDLGLAVGVFSLEMTARSLVMRMLCARARVSLGAIRDGFLAERDYPKLTHAASKLASAPIRIDDESDLSIMQLRARARSMKQQFDTKLFVIDYLQLLRGGGRSKESRQQEVSEVSAGVKKMAKELDVPVIVLCQLNRDLEREKRRPRMSDLRESGSQEADADLVGLLYKPKSEKDDDKDEGVAINLLIAKSRNGPTGEIKLMFLKAITKFETAAKVSDEDEIPEAKLPFKDA